MASQIPARAAGQGVKLISIQRGRAPRVLVPIWGIRERGSQPSRGTGLPGSHLAREKGDWLRVPKSWLTLGTPAVSLRDGAVNGLNQGRRSSAEEGREGCGANMLTYTKKSSCLECSHFSVAVPKRRPTGEAWQWGREHTPSTTQQPLAAPNSPHLPVSAPQKFIRV